MRCVNCWAFRYDAHRQPQSGAAELRRDTMQRVEGLDFLITTAMSGSLEPLPDHGDVVLVPPFAARAVRAKTSPARKAVAWRFPSG